MWQESQAKSVKRSLSRYEKRDLKKLGYAAENALIFPGEPNTEVEELIDVGFDPNRIFCVERDYARAEVLLDYYYDSIRLFCDSMSDFLAKTKNTFSYAHLDYCGHFTEEVANDIIALARKSKKHCFLRTTLFYSRRTSAQKAFEDTFWYKLFELFYTIDIDLDEYELEWPNILAIYSWVVKSFSRYSGETIETVQDFFSLKSLKAGEFKYGVHTPHLYTYKEAEANNQMISVFMEYRYVEFPLSKYGIKSILASLSQSPAYYLKTPSLSS